ncbi:MAG: M43 family zinc metalloprotease [Chitinophagales bacterium]
MKYFFILIGIILFSSKAFTQNVICGSPKKEKEARERNPAIYIEDAKLKQFVHDWIAANGDELRDAPEYIIPVVFHIIHDYGYENITDEQVSDAVRILNEDFRKMNADTNDIINDFKGIAADSRVEFRLANKTSSGLCTNGINHIHSLSTYAGGDNAKLDDWDRSMYLNVWTVKQFSSEVGAGVIAYAYLPSTANISVNAPYDGVIILSGFVGSIGTSIYPNARSLTHEVGHMFGLLHPWGNTNSPGVECGDDDIYDTPETQGWTSCELNGSICHPPVIENVQNFMDYAFCSRMFTLGQADAMQATLNYQAADRDNLWTTSNLNATGTEDTMQTLCAPKADFYASYKMVCTSSSITFHDVSWGGEVSSRSWVFQDGNPATSTDKDPLISFSTPGWKTVTLIVTNATGTATLARDKYIFVSDNSTGQYPVAYWESFIDPADFANNWIVQNPEGNSSLWQLTSAAGYIGYNSVELNNYHNMEGDIDYLITPSFDLSSGGPLYLNFQYSCATNTLSDADINDALNIYSSTNCGQNWLLRASIKAKDLANAGYYGIGYVPGINSPWTGKSILLSTSLYQPNVRFRFEYKSNGHGNNCYLDDVQVQSYTVGINDPDAETYALTIFPNPINENSVALLSQHLSGNMHLYIADITGRTVKELSKGWLPEGEHKFELRRSDLNSSGMYFLIADDGIAITRHKLMVQ